MEDRRITKTKKNLKNTMIEMLRDMQFEKINISELCRRGFTSRITFYTYYDDKYSLVHEIFTDYAEEARTIYHKLQKDNNPANNPERALDNLLECIFQMFYGNFRFFENTRSQKSPYLSAEFGNVLVDQVSSFLQRHYASQCRYPTVQTAALLCNGVIGIINSCYAENMSEEDAKTLARSMYHQLLKSGIFSI